MSSSNKVKILIVVLITLTLVITISYAFFASSINTTNNVSFNTTLEDGATMIRSYNAENENLNITMNLTGFDTFYRDETAVAKKEKNSLEVEFNNITQNDLTCTFDYVFKWIDSTYTKSSGATNELTVEGPFSETQVPDYTTKKITLGSGQIAARAGNIETINVDITTRFYNIVNVDQSGHAGKTYIGQVTVANENCQVASSLSSYIATNTPAGYRGSSHSDSATQNLYRFVGGYQSSDAGYAGNVDNYICLGSNDNPCPGGNIYRIMGVVAEDDSTTGLEAGMLKVTRNGGIAAADYYGNGAGLTGNINSTNYTNYLANCSQVENNWTIRPTGGCYPGWSESNLNVNILNGSYLNNLTFKDSIPAVKWHCFQITNSLSFTAADEYAADLCSSTATKVNLMYAGDYYNSYDNGTTTASNSYPSWIVRGEYEWTLGIQAFNYSSANQYGWVSSALMANGAHSLIYSSYYQNSAFGFNNITVRPVFYLDKGIIYASGNGTYASPFRVAF